VIKGPLAVDPAGRGAGVMGPLAVEPEVVAAALAL
jgi:hypothetical protein